MQGMASMRPTRTSRLLAPFLLALLFGGCAGAAGAQSLKELYEAARAYDATYLSARALAESAEYRLGQAEALGRPSVTATAGASTAEVHPPIGPAGKNNAMQAALNGRLALINTANDATIAQARKIVEAARADLNSAEQDLILRLAQAYFDVLAAQDTLETTRANKAAIAEQLASAKRSFEVGTATITDTREAQARADLASAQEIAAENDLRTKRIALDQLVGRVNVTPNPPSVPVVLPTPAPANPQAWVDSALTEHPAIRRAHSALDVARLETEVARAGARPTFDAVGQIGGSRNTGRVVNLPGSQTLASIGVQMNWPLYTGGAISSRVKETLALEEKARSDLDATQRAVAQNTRVAYYGLESGAAQVRALEAAESSTKLALEATQLGYKVGVRVNLDVLNAQNQLFQTQRDLARARYDVLVGDLRLRQAAGQLGAGDVDALNRLLVP